VGFEAALICASAHDLCTSSGKLGSASVDSSLHFGDDLRILVARRRIFIRVGRGCQRQDGLDKPKEFMTANG